MNFRNQSATNLNSIKSVYQKKTYFLPKYTSTSNFIESTTVSLDDDEIEIESIISALNKISHRIHLVTQKTAERLEHTLTQFIQEYLVPLKGQLKKHPSAPQFQHFLNNKKPQITSCTNQMKNLQVQVELLKLKKLKSQARHDELRKKNLFQLNKIQSSYINKQNPLVVHIKLAKFLQSLLKGVSNSITIQSFLPHIQNIYHQIYKLIQEKQILLHQFKKYSAVMQDFIQNDQSFEN